MVATREAVHPKPAWRFDQFAAVTFFFFFFFLEEATPT